MTDRIFENFNPNFPEHLYDEATGRTHSAMRVQKLKESGSKCSNCTHYRINHLKQGQCTNTHRRVEWYNICAYHQKKKDTKQKDRHEASHP